MRLIDNIGLELSLFNDTMDDDVLSTVAKLAPKAKFICSIVRRDVALGLHVWIQGFIVSAPSSSGGWFEVDDGTATILFTTANWIQGAPCDIVGSPYLGSYCSVLGNVTECSGRRVIDASLVHCLDVPQNVEAMWIVTVSQSSFS